MAKVKEKAFLPEEKKYYVEYYDSLPGKLKGNKAQKNEFKSCLQNKHTVLPTHCFPICKQ